MVLSYSKRIVNRFITYPLHGHRIVTVLIFKRDEGLLEMYGTTLVGEDLGQAHSDFSIKHPLTGKKVPNDVIRQEIKYSVFQRENTVAS